MICDFMQIVCICWCMWVLTDTIHLLNGSTSLRKITDVSGHLHTEPL